ncbi:Oidioi.mRNA.OKI2018_I69.chr2.g6672.t1.cds [Oikopleura dioica]|uniref:Oidioi.mRNA.OKI2018_I69.chr2.g6672.t1.cds n=1 Tax=Oikopleura dioica TaxID=34765 RepID=A0ABN7T471_OIKDI|nr:Oidioi.mRNA.OKI2018_I69.chr2.g6672.t1.cds [Oikopleura dioica]
MPLGRRASLPQLFEKIKTRARSKSRPRRKESIDYTATKAENHEAIDFNLADMRMPTFKGEKDSEPFSKENLKSRERIISAPEAPTEKPEMSAVEKASPLPPVIKEEKVEQSLSSVHSVSSSSLKSINSREAASMRLKSESYLDYIKRMRSRGPASVTRRVIQNGTVAARREKFLQKENKPPQVFVGKLLSNADQDCDRFSTAFEKDIAQFDDFADDGLDDLFEATDESGSAQLTEQNDDNKKHNENRFSSDTFSSYASDTVMEV